MTLKSQPQERPKFDKLTRFELSLAEIMRQNYPFGVGGSEASEMWLDIGNEIADLLGTGKPRFDTDGFWERCFGEDWSKFESPQASLPLD